MQPFRRQPQVLRIGIVKNDQAPGPESRGDCHGVTPEPRRAIHKDLAGPGIKKPHDFLEEHRDVGSDGHGVSIERAADRLPACNDSRRSFWPHWAPQSAPVARR